MSQNAFVLNLLCFLSLTFLKEAIVKVSFSKINSGIFWSCVFCSQQTCTQDKVGDNMSDHSDAKRAGLSREDEDDIVESDIELDDTDVVEPDNDPPQKVRVWQ